MLFNGKPGQKFFIEKPHYSLESTPETEGVLIGNEKLPDAKGHKTINFGIIQF
ncbi:hypothetical protein ACFSKU_21665 [Pontibacter silvestris]|uniref:Uncharacterized protein n=1 Tax=Pontibacter silvestris TaxID=2305183 RepID=A0ABW4X3E8_9BACT